MKKGLTPIWNRPSTRSPSPIPFVQLGKKIGERKEELEITIQQLNDFEVAVDKALDWLGNQEVVLKQIVVVQDEESLAILVVRDFEESDPSGIRTDVSFISFTGLVTLSVTVYYLYLKLLVSAGESKPWADACPI